MTGDLDTTLLAAEIESQYVKNPDKAREIIELIVEPLDGVTAYEPTQINSIVQRYISREILASTAKKIALALDDENLDAAVYADVLNRAVLSVEKVTNKPVSLLDGDLPVSSRSRRGLCTLGLSSKLDDCIGGGGANGELINFIGAPGIGKTSLLCAVGAHMAKQGERVLHLSLEVATPKVVTRYDQALTKMSIADVTVNRKTVAAARKALYKNGGSVDIQNWSYKEVTANDIRGLVHRMRRAKQDISTIIIDYLQLMQPNKRQNVGRLEKRHQYGQLGIDVRSLAVELDVKVLSAWQVNRSGANKNLITEEDIAECWDIIMHSDVVMSINQTKEERRDRYMRIALLKQRESTSRIMVDLHCDFDNMNIHEISEQHNDESASMVPFNE